MSDATHPSFYTPMARLLIVLLALSATGLYFTELFYDPFKGVMGKPQLIGAVATVASVIAVASFFITDERQLKRWMLGLLILPLTLVAVPLMNPKAPLVYVPTLVIVTLVAIAASWRIWVVYGVLLFVAVAHVTQNPSIDPYAMRFWLVAFHIALPLHTLLSNSSDYEYVRQRAAMQFLAIGIVLASILAIQIHLIAQANVSPWPNLYGLFAMAFPLYLLAVKKISLDGVWGRVSAIFFLSVIVHAMLTNGSVATAMLPSYIFFAFLMIKPREAFVVALGLLIMAITIQQNTAVGLFSIDGVFVRYAIANIVYVAILYQLRQLQEGEHSQTFSERDALLPMALFLTYGVLAAALLYWVHGGHRDDVFAANSHLLVTNLFAWLLITWMATTLTLEARRMRQVVQAMQQAKASYEEESHKVATLMKRQAVDSLLGGLAHNLNNLIQPVLMMGKTLLNKPDLAQEQRLQMYRMMYDSAVEQKALLDQIFVHAREMDDTQLATVADLEAVVRFVKSGLSSTQQVLWSSEFDQRLREKTLLLSKGKLHTVLLNVINNGLQAAKQRETAQITLSLQEITDAIVLRVSDNGTGMSAEIQRRAMDKFFTTKAVGEGTGLGLSEAQALLEGVQGELMIEGSSDEGTTMKMIIPLKAG